MSNLEMFFNQFQSIKENCEITQSEYEIAVIEIALDVIEKIYLQTESYSAEEANCEIAKLALEQIKRLIEEPF